MTTHGVSEWMQFWRATGVFMATFVLEDAAAVGAGLLLANGSLAWPFAFTSCFFGIWLGDAGLYALARMVGRGWFERSRWQKYSREVARSEEWFTRRGTPILVFSRILPGTRLPTYLAAGFLRVPAPRFLLITGLAALAWTFVILFLTQAFGSKLFKWLAACKSDGLIVLGAGLALYVLLQFIRKCAARFDSRRLGAKLGRWRHWEFWPAWLFYPPVVAHYFWLAIKYRGTMLPTVANPGIFSGGMVGESKMTTLRDLMVTSPEFTAEAELLTGLTPEERMASIREICARRHISHPYILKPDLGQRGAGIKLIRDESQASAYLRQTSAALLLQRFAEGPHEVGIFYHRFPGDPSGRIFSITEKLFPFVTGDGRSTLAELVWKDLRARFMAEKYLSRFRGRENEIPPTGSIIKLVKAGNHAQGCIFRDGMHLNTPALEKQINVISMKLDGFFIGRYDIRYSNEADLRDGKGFQIIELNGAAAEATSIYDSRYSLFSAYRTLFQQWELVFAIGAENRRRGWAPMTPLHFWKAWRAYSGISATYPAAD